MNINDEWKNFLSPNYDEQTSEDESEMNENNIQMNLSANIKNELSCDEIPKASPIYISTTTKIAYLNTHIDLKELFWKTPILSYIEPKNGVVKKEMKFNSTNIEEVEKIKQRLSGERYFKDQVITSINNPSGKIKFKDVRKISIGISKKDILSYRSKVKSAFYNCFVVILRIKVDDKFKEFHVKIFNTGKMEIPGIKNEKTFNLILELVINILQPHTNEKLDYKKNSSETVLINSNFNCGFYINREILHDILKYKYNIQTIYDPCSYPGIQNKFYYNPDVKEQNGWQIAEDKKELYKNVKDVSFMIFRTGSILISGKCDESVLNVIYEYLKNILITEYKQIYQSNIKSDVLNKDKKRKIRKKNITISIGVN